MFGFLVGKQEVNLFWLTDLLYQPQLPLQTQLQGMDKGEHPLMIHMDKEN